MNVTGEISTKRGRKATPPDPADGPVAAFARELWELKVRAGDPSYAAMCGELGAAASKSSLAAATRGTALPSWETTWEFVRVLDIGLLEADPETARAEWLARWRGAVPDSTPPAPSPPPEPKRRGLAAVIIASVLAAGLVYLVTASAPKPTGPPPHDDAAFEGDVTIPDGTVIAPGETVTKVWQLRNTGTVRWEGRFLARVNTTSCYAPDLVPIPVTEPGQSVRISVDITAGAIESRCKIDWKMTDASRRMLFPGKNPIFLDVVVREPA